MARERAEKRKVESSLFIPGRNGPLTDIRDSLKGACERAGVHHRPDPAPNITLISGPVIEPWGEAAPRAGCVRGTVEVPVDVRRRWGVSGGFPPFPAGERAGAFVPFRW
jgi:hypothetical protein